MSKMIDMTGWVMKEHGVPESRLTVLKRADNDKNGRIKWLCKCECGNECEVYGHSLRSGNTKSCGCLQQEKVSESNKTNIIGQKFGKLIILYDTGKRSKNGSIYWHCKCECGNECDVLGTNLISHHTNSCGCIGESYGEYLIKKLLIENNIVFETEKRFNDCRDQKALPFDFYINNSYIIEFDGIQHYDCYPNNLYSWNNQQNLIQTQKHDKIKNKYCFDNNIPIIRIPYTHLNKLCLEDLLLETSKYKLKQEE